MSFYMGLCKSYKGPVMNLSNFFKELKKFEKGEPMREPQYWLTVRRKFAL